MNNYIILLLIPFISYFITIFFIKIHKNIGIVDLPEKRKVHKTKKVRGGGISIFFTFLIFTPFLFKNINNSFLYFILASSILIILGIIDDYFNINAIVKLIFQITSSFILVYFGDLYITNLSMPLGITLNFSIYISYIFSILWLLLLINSINLIDGLDGLASGFSIIFFSSFAISSFLVNDEFISFFSLIMMLSTLGFWKLNFYPAIVFLGDSGSMFLGFSLGFISLMGFKNISFFSIFIPFIILSIPILDVLFSILRRKRKNISFKIPDKNHIHHNLLKVFQNDHKKTVLYLYLLVFLLSLSTIVYRYSFYASLIIIFISVVLFIYKIDLLKLIGGKNDKKNKEKEIENNTNN